MFAENNLKVRSLQIHTGLYVKTQGLLHMEN